MFLFRYPDDASVKQFLRDRSTDDFSYVEVGATATESPAGYKVDHNRARLGEGANAFEKARSAIRTWEMFNLGWVKLFYPNSAIEVGTTVAILVNHFGFYSLNGARIVYVLDEDGDISRYGFAYGTLTEHGEVGEERFSVEFNRATNEVWYDLFAFSRPGCLFVKLGYPLARYLQRAFATDSKAAMVRAVS